MDYQVLLVIPAILVQLVFVGMDYQDLVQEVQVWYKLYQRYKCYGNKEDDNH